MHVWEEMSSAQTPEEQAIFLLGERNRVAHEAVRAVAKEMVQRDGVDSLQYDALAEELSSLAGALHTIYTTRPDRLRVVTSRISGYTVKGRCNLPELRTPAARYSLAKIVNHILSDVNHDSEAIYAALAESGETPSAPVVSAAHTTFVWRSAVTFCIVLLSGHELAAAIAEMDKSPGASPIPLAYTIARSAIRPDDWSVEEPIRLDDLHLLSHEVESFMTGALTRIVEEMRSLGLNDTTIRLLLDRRQAPRWLVRKVLGERTASWLIRGFL